MFSPPCLSPRACVTFGCFDRRAANRERGFTQTVTRRDVKRFITNRSVPSGATARLLSFAAWISLFAPSEELIKSKRGIVSCVTTELLDKMKGRSGVGPTANLSVGRVTALSFPCSSPCSGIGLHSAKLAFVRLNFVTRESSRRRSARSLGARRPASVRSDTTRAASFTSGENTEWVF